MRTAIVGSRTVPRSILPVVLGDLLQHTVPSATIVSGGAEGIDSFAEGFARCLKMPLLVFEPKWDKYGKAAAFKRNQQIVDAADEIIVITVGDTPGSMDTLARAKASGKPTMRINFIILDETRVDYRKERFNV